MKTATFISIIRKIRLQLISVKMRYLLYAGRRVEHDVDVINKALTIRLNNATPLLVSRLGSVEVDASVRAMMNCLDHSELLTSNSGVFPDNEEIIRKFANIYLSSIRSIDTLGVWGFFKNEEPVILEYGVNSSLVAAKGLEPYYSTCPWTKVLQGKTVLVIHPFVKSIQSQYLKRQNLFSNREILPGFNLKTIQAIQSLGGESTYRDWFAALEAMKKEINNVEFDIALIGAGAYGLPLGVHIKKQGKKAIHLGGAVQILFGIKGKRWDSHPVISKMYNQYWVRPLAEERPADYSNVEGGCYW